MKTLTLLACIAAPLALGTWSNSGAEAKTIKFRDHHHDRHHDNWKISCNTARHMLRERGYSPVVVKSCISTVYSFYAVKKGRTYIFRVDSRTGFITRG